MKELLDKVIHGDCLNELLNVDTDSIDMVYLDPPFFTNRNHSSITRDRKKKFCFSDIWQDLSDYAEFMEVRIQQIHRVLKDTGSIFVHCDASANFILRPLLDDIFGKKQFRSEIIWTYKRWSNSAKGLLPAHQTIFFYSKTDKYKFNRIYGEYSETTNIDQILQLRVRDEHGVSTYATDKEGNVIFGGEKKGVPLSDVWDIPFLNPKAKERTGYPTQKPVLLLERIIELTTDRGDLILDPFSGSGTTLVAAKILGRNYIGIDSSKEAVELAQSRLYEPKKTESALLKQGRDSYINANKDALAVLNGLDLLPVQRNSGIDAFLKIRADGSLVPIKVQRNTETITDAARKLERAVKSKKSIIGILVRTYKDDLFDDPQLPEFIKLVDSTALNITNEVILFMGRISFEEDKLIIQNIEKKLVAF